MTINTEYDLLQLQKIGKIVANTIRLVGSKLEPGISTQELDYIAASYLAEQGARSAPKIIYDFPGSICISINHEIAHGLPSSKKIQAGDLVNIDVSAERQGYFADSGYTFLVPPINQSKLALCKASQATLSACLAKIKSNLPLNIIGKTITEQAKRRGYTVIRNLGSHGVGKALHEAPEFIPPYYDKKDRRLLHKGMVITIEPFLSTGPQYAQENADGWTLTVPAGHLAAQYEHTLVVTDRGALVVTR